MSMESPSSRNRVARLLLCELDFHYLVISFLLSILCVGYLGEVRAPMKEVERAVLCAPIVNGFLVVISFIALAPWGFAWSAAKRCLVWVPVNFLAGTILTLLFLSLRVLYAWAAMTWL